MVEVQFALAIKCLSNKYLLNSQLTTLLGTGNTTVNWTDSGLVFVGFYSLAGKGVMKQRVLWVHVK